MELEMKSVNLCYSHIRQLHKHNQHGERVKAKFTASLLTPFSSCLTNNIKILQS